MGERDAQIVARHLRARVELERLPELLRGLVVLLLHQQVVAEIVVQVVDGGREFEGLAMRRFAERPEAGFVAQDAQPGVVFGARSRGAP